MGLKCNHHLHCLSPLRALLCAQIDRFAEPYCTMPRGKRKTERRVMKQKLKTHTAMAKRVKITGSGKIMRRKVALSHLRRNKSPHAVRSMDKMFPLATSDKRRIKRLLPYSL